VLSGKEPKPIKTHKQGEQSEVGSEGSAVRSHEEAEAAARARRRTNSGASSNGSSAERNGGDAVGKLPPKSPGTRRRSWVAARTSSFSGLGILPSPSPRSPLARMLSKKNSKKWALPAGAGQNGGGASAVA